MRADQAHETDDPDGADGERRDQGGPQQGPHADVVDLHTHGPGPGLTERERSEFPLIDPEQRNDSHQGDQHHGDGEPGGTLQRPHGPKHHPLEGFLGGPVLDQHQYRLEPEDQGNAQQDDGLATRTPQPRHQCDHPAGDQSQRRGANRHGGLGEEGKTDPGGDHDGRTTPRSGRDAQGVGLCQGVVENGLHLRAGEGQCGSGHHRHESGRGTQIHHDGSGPPRHFCRPSGIDPQLLQSLRDPSEIGVGDVHSAEAERPHQHGDHKHDHHGRKNADEDQHAFGFDPPELSEHILSGTALRHRDLLWGGDALRDSLGYLGVGHDSLAAKIPSALKGMNLSWKSLQAASTSGNPSTLSPCHSAKAT